MTFLDPFPTGDDAAEPAEPTLLRGWTIPRPAGGRGLALEVSVGDLAVAPAEVLCVSTNPRLTLLGGTGAAIVEAGGWSIRREADEQRRAHRERTGSEELEEGRIVRTGPGRLACRFLLLCVASGETHRSSEKTIRSCVLGALERADEDRVSSVAMPIFGTGHAGFPFDRAVSAQFAALREATTSVDRVVLALDHPERAEALVERLDEELGRESASTSSGRPPSGNRDAPP